MSIKAYMPNFDARDAIYMTVGAIIATIACNVIQVPAPAPVEEKQEKCAHISKQIPSTFEDGIPLQGAAPEEKIKESSIKKSDIKKTPNTLKEVPSIALDNASTISGDKLKLIRKKEKQPELHISAAFMQEIKPGSRLLLKDNSIVKVDSVAKEPNCLILYARYILPTNKEYLVECYTDTGRIEDDINSPLSITGIIRP